MAKSNMPPSPREIAMKVLDKFAGLEVGDRYTTTHSLLGQLMQEEMDGIRKYEEYRSIVRGRGDSETSVLLGNIIADKRKHVGLLARRMEEIGEGRSR